MMRPDIANRLLGALNDAVKYYPGDHRKIVRLDNSIVSDLERHCRDNLCEWMVSGPPHSKIRFKHVIIIRDEFADRG